MTYMDHRPDPYRPQPQGDVVHHYHHIGARPTKTWMNITAFVLSLLGIGLGAVVFGHLGVAAANRGEADSRGLGIAALVLGYLNLALVAFLALMYFGLVAMLFGTAAAVS